jgi:hypothetical protein
VNPPITTVTAPPVATAAFDNKGVEDAGKPSITASDGASVARFKQLSAVDGTKKSPPNSTKGTMVTDSRPADDRTQRAAITPPTNNDKPARIKTFVPPVEGNRQTSRASITNHPRACTRHNSGRSD